MAKEMRCGDLMPGCDKVIEGKDENEVIAKASEHARKDHNVTNMTPDMQEKVRGAIHEKR
jgi:predicted small metal-binding protein